jgi:DNA polymerase I-like protein with 3'-5' exonuclease and polymerase domains
MDIITIDFETYYDREYSLSKMTTEEYIRDPRFEVICVGVKINDNPTDVYTGLEVGAFLKSIDYSKCALLAHHAAFDGAILSWHYGIKPKFWFDTLSMARPLHNVTVGGSLAALVTYYNLGAKGTEVVDALGKRRNDFTKQELEAYMNYCANDVDLTYALLRKMMPQFPRSELMVIDQTVRMFTEPVIRLNEMALGQHLADMDKAREALLGKLDLIADGRDGVTIMNSNEQFAAMLRSFGVDPPMKISPTTGKQTYAFAKTDKAFTDLLEHPVPAVQVLASVRLGTKSTIETTRTKRFMSIASRGRLPIMLNYYGAHTGRFSGGDKVNLQNLPARGNTKIRHALTAPPGHTLIACDSSQIEARMVAWLAGQDDLVAAFREKRDVYSEFASEVYGRTITSNNKSERFVGKTCILGLGYGMGAQKFQRTLEIGQAGISVKVDTNEAERIVRLYRQKNFKIVELWRRCDHALNGIVQGGQGTISKCVDYDSEGVRLPNGLYVRYPALHASTNGYKYIDDARAYRAYLRKKLAGESVGNEPWVNIYGGKVTENIIQALAAIAIREQMAAIGALYKVAFQVHDEIVIVVPDEQANEAQETLERIMSTPPVWAPDIPLACESGQGNTYGATA